MRSAALDVVIAGAGPAGSSLALRLAREGFAVGLVEARCFPRFKPCGEFLSPQALALLDDLGALAEVRRRGARALRGIEFRTARRSARGRFVEVGRSRPRFDHALAVRREVLDEVLLRAALGTGGVELLEGWRCESLVRGDDGAVLGLVARGPDELERELRAPFTIGADGLRSRVARELGVRRPRSWLDRLALVTHYRGLDLGDAAEVHLFEDGFLAAAPVDAGLASVNLIVERAAYRAACLGPEDFFTRRVAELPGELRERLSAAERVTPVRGVGPLSQRTTRSVFDGAALVGDACGYVDPLPAEGIYFALRGSELLAQSLVRALRERRRGAAALRPYWGARQRELGPRELLDLALQRGLRHPRLVDAALSLCAARPALGDLLVSMTGDYAPLAELARPGVWARTLARPAH